MLTKSIIVACVLHLSLQHEAGTRLHDDSYMFVIVDTSDRGLSDSVHKKANSVYLMLSPMKTPIVGARQRSHMAMHTEILTTLFRSGMILHQRDDAALFLLFDINML